MDRASMIAGIKAAKIDTKSLRKVEVQGWPDVVYVRHITVAESDRLEPVGKDDPLRSAKLIARMARDSDGELLFDESNAEDVEMLSQQSVAVYNAIMNGAAKDADSGNA